MYNKNESLYFNNISKLRKKTPIAELSDEEVIKTEEFQEWIKRFYEENKNIFSSEDEVMTRFTLNYNYIIEDFNRNLVYKLYNSETN